MSHLTTHDDWITNCYLMDSWEELRHALALYDAALIEAHRLYEEAAPLRAQYGITRSAPMGRSKIAITAQRALNGHDRMARKLMELNTLTRER